MSWLTDMLAQPFMRNAYITGTVVAVACGLVGYFLVLRAQVFSADALSHVAFTGALGALAFGVDLRLGLFVVTTLVAIGMGLLGRSGRADDVVIGSVFVWILGLGVLFLSIYATQRSGANGTAGVSVLFGSILGLSSGDVIVTSIVAAVVAAGTIAIARPLLFATIDPAVAAARGVKVRALGVAFLGLAGLTSAAGTQAVGALLLLGLLSAPGAAALRITSRPYRGLALSAALGAFAMWAGLAISYEVPKIPPSFAVIAVAVFTMACAYAVPARRRARHIDIVRPA